MPKQDALCWRNLAHRRNGLQGQLISARNVFRSVQQFEGISTLDKAKLRVAFNCIEDVLSTWDKHYIKHLRSKIDQRPCKKGE